MPLGKEVGLGPGHIVLDGDPAPSLSAHAYCGQTVAHLSNCWALVRERKCPGMPDDTLPWAVQKWLNWSRCRFGCGLGWAQGSNVYVTWVHTGAIWRIWLNRPCAARWGLSVKLLWPLVVVLTANVDSAKIIYCEQKLVVCLTNYTYWYTSKTTKNVRVIITDIFNNLTTIKCINNGMWSTDDPKWP